MSPPGAGLRPFVRFPDSQLWLTTYYRVQLAAIGGYDDVRVSTDYREVGTGRALWLRRDGGSRISVVTESARFGLNVFAPDPTGAAVNDLAELARALTAACPSGPVKAYTELSGPIQIDDPNGIPCRYLTFELVIKGSTS